MKFLQDNRILEMAEASPNDAAEILEYLKKVGSESDNLTFDKEGVGLTIEQEKTMIEKNNKSFNHKIFTAKVNNVIVSVASIEGSKRERLQHNVNIGLSVLKEYWNLGVGNHFLNYVMNYCRMTMEIENACLEVREDNEFAIKLYKKFGFKQVGTYTNKIKVDEKYYNCFIMEINL